MRKIAFVLTVLWLVAAGAVSRAQDTESTPPVRVDKIERAEVRLVLLDVIVIDSDGNPVPGLEREDFEIRHDGEVVSPDVLETRCEPEPIQPMTADRATPPRRLVLFFDYLHLSMLEREWALDTAIQMVRAERTEGDEVMVAALTGGLRIEQPFTTDTREVLASLKRMQKDISLWNGNFDHTNEFGFVRGVESLFDVLATAAVGPKAVVLYSAMQDVPLDNQFERIAAIAAASRCALYTVDPYGLVTPDLRLASRRGPPG